MSEIPGTVVALEQALPWFPRLDPMRQRVLIGLATSLGLQGLLGFPKMLGAVERGDYETAAAEMLTGRLIERLKERATGLAIMMRTGAPQ